MFKHIHLISFLVSALALPALLLPTPLHAAPTLLIGEVAWAGSSLSKADEWIELWNLGDTPVSLAGYTLSGASKEPLVFPDNAVIPARNRYLVSNYASDYANTLLRVVPDMVTSDLSLSNSALNLTLTDNNNVEVDHVGNGKTPEAGSNVTPIASMVRTLDGWMTASLSENLKSNSDDLGTPGVCDLCIYMSFPKMEMPAEDPSASSTAETVSPEPTDVNSGLETEPTDVPTDATEENLANTETVEPNPNPESVSEMTESSTTTNSAVAEVVSTTTTNINVTSSDIAPEFKPEITENPTESATSTPAFTVSDASAVSSTEAQETVVTLESESEPEDSGASTLPPRYDLVRLNEVMPNPMDGKEWIEVMTLDPNVEISLVGVTIHDASSKIYTFGDVVLDNAHPTVVAELSSARLNNGGDTLTVNDPNGSDLEIFTYDGSTKGWSWARNPNGTGSWMMNETPTQGAPNIFPTSVVFSEDQNNEGQNLSSEQSENNPSQDAEVTNSDLAPYEDTESKSVNTSNTNNNEAQKLLDPVRSLAVLTTPAKIKATPKTPAKTKTAPASSKNTDFIQELSIDMTHDEEFAGIHVRLHGTVGSMPGIVSGHAFILLSPTGRGIRVSVPTSMKLPELGASVAVTGKLTYASNDIPYLKLAKEDTWQPEENLIPMSREVNMLAPSHEDAWSLVTIEGTVGNVKTNKILLDVDGTEVAVTIKDMIGFRATRLSKGDTIQVTGLLDLGTDDVHVIPRSADEVALLTHAEPVAQAPVKPIIPGWAPFGAAGLAVAGNEGFKRAKAHRKRKNLINILEEKEPERV
ncbi:MAG: lamin tail domain-containing protein [bacterium]|nr:lamin tail domain-containing protein [bacterium]